MVNRNIIIILSVVVAIALCGFFMFIRKPKAPVVMAPAETELRYAILSARDTGTTTPIVVPTQVIIQISDPEFTASSTTITDEQNLMEDEKIESYGSLTIVSGSIVASGMISINAPGALPLTYTFITQASASPTP